MKLHVVDKYTNETIEYLNENELQIIKVKEFSTDRYGELHIDLVNGTSLFCQDEERGIYTNRDQVNYSPVYDVETCEIEDYSMYEPEDIVGYVNRGYYVGE